MSLLLVFALSLIVAVLLSEVASRSIVSTAALFLVVGLVVGATGLVSLEPTGDGTLRLVEVALFAVLYTDAMRVGVRDLADAWRLPGRALLLGLPLVLVGTALAAWGLLDLSWGEAFLIGAVLAPTDPVLASAIIGREAVPNRLRYLLGVESGVNDGLALPAVLLLLAATGGSDTSVATLLEELAIGVAIGVAMPYVIVKLARVPGVGAVGAYERLLGFGIGLAVFAVAESVHANLFLAAFAAGVTVRSTGPEIRETFHDFGELVTELLKLLGLLVFGVLVPVEELVSLPWTAWLLAVVVLVAVRPAALQLALLRSGLGRAQRLAMSWFGPKGFASVLYGLLVLQSPLDDAPFMFAVIAAVIGLSIVAHSSTDVLVARYFRRRADGEPGAAAPDAPAPDAPSPPERPA